MDQDQARKAITDWARESWGRFLDVREINIVRRATGRVWTAELYCTTREGDIHVGNATLDDRGEMIELLDVDGMVDALVAVRTAANQLPADGPTAEDDFGALADDTDFSSLADEVDGFSSGDDMDSVFNAVDPDTLHHQANQLIATGEQENLLAARDILPQLLAYQDRRGPVLQQMAELEMLLGELEMGLRHLEAAAREYADVANIEGLAMVAELAAGIMPEEQFAASTVRMLFDQLRNRLTPLEQLKDAPLFVGLGDEENFALEGLAHPVSIDRGEVLLREGDVANMAFIIKSGTVSIRIESSEGGARVVRACFPGDFIGESSVIGEPGATCTATVQGEAWTELWQFDGQELRQLAKEYPEVRMRIESAKTLHQLDSFISMNESTATLDVHMRDQLLSCISRIGRVTAGTVLNPAGDVPRDVHLIVNGHIEYRIGGEVAREYDADQFAGLRDTLHELPLEGEFVAATDCLLVYMDTARLRAIARDATPEVIAVLEKLE